MREHSATHLRRDEGLTGDGQGGPLTYKVTAEQTGGAYSLFEETFRPGEGVAPHIQHREDECFYVVEGQVEFRLDGEAVVASPGSLIYVPRGSVHAFTNTGEAPARILDLFTPGPQVVVVRFETIRLRHLIPAPYLGLRQLGEQQIVPGVPPDCVLPLLSVLFQPLRGVLTEGSSIR